MKFNFLTYLALGFFIFGGALIIGVLFFWPKPVTPIAIEGEIPMETREVIRKPLPTRIQIRDLIDLGVSEMQFGPKGWQVSDTDASIASTSAHPGEDSNIVIYSHNLKKLFGKLNSVQMHDTITLTTADGLEHAYTVTKKVVLTPAEYDILRPTNSEVLTLYTCTGFLDSKRLVVQAVPVQ